MADTDITIRPMTEEDLPQVAAIEAENFSVPWKRDDFAHYLEDDRAVFLTARINAGPAAGYIGCLFAADEGDITNVSVSSELRGRGIGMLLVTELIRKAKERCCARIYLEVRASNTPAIHLYGKAGFEKVGVRKRYYSSPVEDALLMCLNM